MFGRDAGAAVTHSEHAVIGSRQDFAAQPRNLARFHSVGFDRQLAATLWVLAQHRVARIDRQVDDDLFELTGIGTDRSHASTVTDRDANFLVHQPGQQRADIGDDVRQLQDLRAQGLLARKREQLTGQVSRTVGVAAYLLDIIVIAVTW